MLVMPMLVMRGPCAPAGGCLLVGCGVLGVGSGAGIVGGAAAGAIMRRQRESEHRYVDAGARIEIRVRCALRVQRRRAWHGARRVAWR